jgi:ABA responsive element binding factor
MFPLFIFFPRLLDLSFVCLRKDFGSMNMDKLLSSIWTAEESQAMASTSWPATVGEDGALQRQGSLTLSRMLIVYMVDEVWRDFVHEGTSPDGGGGRAKGS